jgi:GNAT superfamily N-acetyltransferase
MSFVRVELLTDVDSPAVADELGEVLADCVAGGASVGFLAPFGRDEARRWWAEALPDPDAVTWVAREDGGRIVGVVRLVLARQPNGTHRAEVVKLLVHRDARGRGCAARLMAALEDGARGLGRTVLTLDTQTGSPAESLYLRRGWRHVGVIEDYALTTDGVLAPTTIMAKHLPS